MRIALVVASGILLLTSRVEAQGGRAANPAGDRIKGNPTVEFMIGPHLGSGTLREFNDPVIFDQHLDYSGYFLKSGLTLPMKARWALLFRFDYDHLKSKGEFLFPLIDEFEVQRTGNLVSLGMGARFELR